MNKIVCIDSNICVWGIKKDGDPNKIPIAERFLEYLDSNKTKILIPSPVIVEILSHIKDHTHKTKILSLISTNKIIVKPLDVVAALKCSELLLRTFTDAEIKQYSLDNKIPKTKIKYDSMICAIAIVNKCDCIYTDNLDDFNRYSHGEIKILGMPNIPVQQNIFTLIETGKKINIATP